MLGKLLKHEFKATGRHFLLMYVFFTLITICNKIFLEITVNNKFWETFQILFMIAYVLTCAAIFVLTTILIITRFYKNMMGDEGYLMFTLPVTVSQHIISKCLTAFVWSVLSAVIFFLSILLLISGHGVIEFFNKAGELISQVFDYCGPQLWISVIIYAIAIPIGTFYSILQYYMSVSIGQLFNKHRVLAAFGAYFGFNFILQNIISFGFLFLNVSSFFSPEHVDIHTEAEFIQYFLQYMNIVGITALVINTALAVGFFFVTRFILTKKLNLE